MSRKIQFKRQYKPIGFGDPPFRGTVEGHRNAMYDAAETRSYNRAMKEVDHRQPPPGNSVLNLLKRLVPFKRDT
jgi:hypothetical protein